MAKQPVWRELLVGGVRGVAAALLGSIILALMGTLFLVGQEGAWEDLSTLEGIWGLLVYALLPSVVILFGFSFVPAALGGMALAGVVRYLTKKASHFDLACAVAGMVIGATAAGASAWLSLRTTLWVLLEEPNPYILLAIPACIIGAVAGGLVGRKLGSNTKDNTCYKAR